MLANAVPRRNHGICRRRWRSKYTGFDHGRQGPTQDPVGQGGHAKQNPEPSTSQKPSRNNARPSLDGPSAEREKRAPSGAGVKAMFGACGLWRFRGMFDMGQPPRKQGNGITIDGRGTRGKRLFDGKGF